MTCASCADRVEHMLDGVSYASGKARVTVPAGVEVAALVAQVEAAGYTASPPAGPDVDHTRDLGGRLVRPTRPTRARWS